MSDNAAEVEVLDDEASAFLTKDEIIGLIRALPDPLCGYSSWIFVGSRLSDKLSKLSLAIP